MDEPLHHHTAPSSEEEGNFARRFEAPSSSEEGVGGGGVTRKVMLERAAAMRSNPSEPERRLWMRLRDSRFAGYKFRRQSIVGWRIVDFFCPAKALIVEIDGETHDRVVDLARDAQIDRRFGFCTIRFTNAEVMHQLDDVLSALLLALERRSDRWLKTEKHHPPAPSSEEEGGK